MSSCKDVVGVIKASIDKLDVTLESVFEALETVESYKNLEGYDEIAEALAIKCVTCVMSEFKTAEGLNRFYSENKEEQLDLVLAMMDLICLHSESREHASIEACVNCLETLEECRHGQAIVGVPHVGLKFRQGGQFSFEEMCLQRGLQLQQQHLREGVKNKIC